MSSTATISPVVDIHASKQPQVYAAAVTTYLLAVIAVALRFWARKLMKVKIWVDDWTAAVALLIATGFFVSAIVWLHQGLGHHYEVLGEDFQTHFGKNIFVTEFLYFIIIGLVKLSILAFYWRLFSASIRIPCYILGAITACWEIAVILVTVFQCVPVSGSWNKKIHAKCLDEKHFYLGNSVPNIATDIALLLLPVPYIWRLHRTTSQKIALAGTFMLGGFISVISIIRLTIILKIDINSPDLDYNTASSFCWSIGESNIAIVAACLPSLRPILSLILYGEPSPSVRGTRRKAFGRPWTRSRSSALVNSHGQPKSASDCQHSFIPLPDEFGFSGTEQLHGTAVTSSGERKFHDHEDIEMQTGGQKAKSGIQVRSDVIVQSTQTK